MADRSPGLCKGFLLAAGCLAFALPRTGLGATAPPPDEVPGAGSGERRVAAGEEVRSDTRWRIAPIQYWGSLSYENRFDTGEQQPRTMQQLLTAKINGLSYLWQPWFASVNGGLGVSFSRFASGDDLGAGSTGAFLTGSGQAQFFPFSRFPFEAHFDVGDSRTGGNVLAASDYRTLRVGLSQRYRPESGSYTLYGSYEHTAQSGRGFGDNSQDLLTGEYRSNWNHQSLQMTVNLNLARSASTGQETEFDSVLARHNYGPSTELSVDTTASVIRNRYDLLVGGSDTAIAQLVSIGVWRPAGQPLTVTGSSRFSALRATGELGDSHGGAVSLGASYRYNRNLQLSISGNAGFASGAGRRDTTYGGIVGANYAGDTVYFAGLNYDWSVAANAAHTKDPAGKTALLSTQLNQALGRAVTLPDGSTLAGSIGANVTAVNGSVASNRQGETSGNVVQAGSNASLTWSKSAGSSSGYVRGTVSDTRQITGEPRSSFLFANLQVSGTWNFSRSDALTGDFTYQYTRQDPGFLNVSGVVVPLASGGRKTTSKSASANIQYRHNRLFGVQRLRFVSQLLITDSAVVQENVFAVPQDQVSRFWDNRLEYLIGRLTTTLAARVYEVQGVRREGVYFRIERAIGSTANPGAGEF